jgi:hypothetical protein
VVSSPPVIEETGATGREIESRQGIEFLIKENKLALPIEILVLEQVCLCGPCKSFWLKTLVKSLLISTYFIGTFFYKTFIKLLFTT